MRSLPVFFASMCLFLGVGCTNPLAATEKAATDVLVGQDAQLILRETVAGFDNPFTDEPTTQVRITSKDAEAVEIAWTRTERQETQASQEARAAAMNTPVGSKAEMPEPVYEEVVRSGTLRADGLEEGKRVALPSFWSEGGQDFGGQENSLLWLSKAQYEQLANTRQAIVIFGGADSVLEGLLSFYQSAAAFAENIQGNGDLATVTDGYDEYIAITAEPEWGSFTLRYNNEKIKVPTIVAENTFARFEILANPENPLILSVIPKPTSWLMNAIESLHPGSKVQGYKVTSIDTP